MKIPCILLLSSLFLSCARANDFSLTFSRGGDQQVITTTLSRIAQTKNYSLGDPLPVSFAEAIQAVSKLSRESGEPVVALEEIEFQLTSSTGEPKAFYVVTVRTAAKRYRYFLVLLDGEIIASQSK
jgi:hypothetical protein